MFGFIQRLAAPRLFNKLVSQLTHNNYLPAPLVRGAFELVKAYYNDYCRYVLRAERAAEEARARLAGFTVYGSMLKHGAAVFAFALLSYEDFKEKHGEEYARYIQSEVIAAREGRVHGEQYILIIQLVIQSKIAAQSFEEFWTVETT